MVLSTDRQNRPITSQIRYPGNGVDLRDTLDRNK